jgi:hypothetical protein
MSCCGPATASENSSLRSTSPLLEGLHENIKLLVGNTRSSGMPALYAYSSCSASIKRRNGIATSHRELFHNRGGRRLLISNHLEPTPGSTISPHIGWPGLLVVVTCSRAGRHTRQLTRPRTLPPTTRHRSCGGTLKRAHDRHHSTE